MPAPSPEFLLLQQAIRIGDPAAARQAAQEQLAQGIDWPAFLDLAAYHSIRPQVACLFKGLPDGLVPATVLAELKAANKRIAIRQMANVGEFLQINLQLQAAGVLAVPYKGFWLAHTAYPSVIERESGDVDLYFAPDDLAKVQKIMFDRGYQIEAGSRADDPQQVLQYLGEYNFDQYEGGKRVFLFEFHANVGNQRLGLNIPLSDLEDQIQEQNFRGQMITVFSPTALLFLTTLHHGAKEAWRGLRYVLDVAQLLQNCADQIDWEWLRYANQRYGTSRLFGAGLGLAQHVSNVSLPTTIEQELSSKAYLGLIQNRILALEQASAHLDRGYRIYAQRFWSIWNTHSTWLKRWQAIVQHLTPHALVDQDALQGNRLSRFFMRLKKIMQRSFISRKQWQ